MKTKEFAEGYEKAINDTMKNMYLGKNLKVIRYIDVKTKIETCEKIINSTSYKILPDGTRTDEIVINSLSRYILFTLEVIKLYTNIEIDTSDVFTEYDSLNENGLIAIIFNEIPESEVSEFKTILDMMLNDLIQNKLSIPAFISSQVERFGDIVGTLLSADVLSQYYSPKSDDNVDNIGTENK